MNVVNNLINSSEDICDFAKRNSGKILSIGSSLLAAGACAGTGIATWKAKDKIEEHNDILHDLHEKKQFAKTEEDKKQLDIDIMNQYGKTIGTVAGYYVPPAILLGGSIVCDICLDRKLEAAEHKLALASGALILVKSAYDKAQQKAIEKYGEEEAADIFYDSKVKEVKTVDSKGKEKIETIKVYEGSDIVAANPCSILLGDGINSILEDIDINDTSLKNNRLWNNINTLHHLERKYTYELNAKGYVYVKDIYKELGVEAMSKAQEDLWNYWGWFKDKNKIDHVIARCRAEGIDPFEEDPETGMSPVDEANSVRLGIDMQINENYRLGYEPMVWIVPNCIGDITELRFPNSNRQIQNFKEATAN